MRILFIMGCMINFFFSLPAIAGSENYTTRFHQARQLEQQSRPHDAEAIYKQLIESDPSRPEAYNNLANILVSRGQLTQAQSMLEKAMQTNPAYATLYDNLSKLYVEMARDSYGKALRLDTQKSRFQLTTINELQDDAASQQLASVNTREPTAIADPVIQEVSTEPQNTLKKANTGLMAEDKADIITTLEGWAAAWSEQAADVYLVFYDEKYHPPGQTRKSWVTQRRAKLQRPDWIQVGLKNVEIKPLNNKEARVQLIQEYRASNYRDTTLKEFKMRQTHDGWRIVAERSISRIN